MKLQIKPARWLCMATSFAMALDVPIATLLEEIGDGSEIAFPSLPDPECRKGHHIQEIIPACLGRGIAVTPVELFPLLQARPHVWPALIYRAWKTSDEERWQFITHVIKTTRGVLDGFGKSCGHAVAYDRGQVFDPDGRHFPFSQIDCQNRNFIPRCAWRFDQIRSS